MSERPHLYYSSFKLPREAQVFNQLERAPHPLTFLEIKAEHEFLGWISSVVLQPERLATDPFFVSLSTVFSYARRKYDELGWLKEKVVFSDFHALLFNLYYVAQSKDTSTKNVRDTGSYQVAEKLAESIKKKLAVTHVITTNDQVAAD